VASLTTVGGTSHVACCRCTFYATVAHRSTKSVMTSRRSIRCRLCTAGHEKNRSTIGVCCDDVRQTALIDKRRVVIAFPRWRYVSSLSLYSAAVRYSDISRISRRKVRLEQQRDTTGIRPPHAALLRRVAVHRARAYSKEFSGVHNFKSSYMM